MGVLKHPKHPPGYAPDMYMQKMDFCTVREPDSRLLTQNNEQQDVYLPLTRAPSSPCLSGDRVAERVAERLLLVSTSAVTTCWAPPTAAPPIFGWLALRVPLTAGVEPSKGNRLGSIVVWNGLWVCVFESNHKEMHVHT